MATPSLAPVVTAPAVTPITKASTLTTAQLTPRVLALQGQVASLAEVAAAWGVQNGLLTTQQKQLAALQDELAALKSGGTLATPASRTVQSFRVNSSISDDMVWQTALDWMSTTGQPLRQDAPFQLYPTRSGVHTGGYCVLDVPGLTLKASNMIRKRCDASTAPDLTLPTRTNPGPLQGAALYVADGVPNLIIRGLKAPDFRFGIAFRDQPDAPEVVECDFSYCDCGNIFYQGCQTAQLLNNRFIGGGVLLIAAATCLVAQGPDGQPNPYRGKDNNFLDGVRVANIEGYDTFQAITSHPYFDAFHIASFQRPGVDSYCYPNGAASRYYTSGGTEYAADSYYRKPTGRVVFAPGVNGGRLVTTFFWHNTDMRGACERGAVLINSPVENLQLTGGAWERLTEDGLDVPMFEVRSVVGSGLINCTAFTPNCTQGNHPLLRLVDGLGSLTDLVATGAFEIQGLLKAAGGAQGGSIATATLNRYGIVGAAGSQPAGSQPAVTTRALGPGLAHSVIVVGFHGLINTDPGNDFTVSDFQPAKAGDVVKLVGASGVVYFYSANTDPGDGSTGLGVGTNGVAPAGTAYVRAHTRAADYANASLSFQ